MCRRFTAAVGCNCRVSRARRLLFVAAVHRLLAISLGLAASGCVIPYALPPLKAEAGGATITGEKPLFHAGAGTHLASGVLNRAQTFDVGAGGFVETTEDGLHTRAAYADASVFIDKSHSARTSVGIRGELRWSPARTDAPLERGFGAKLRIEREYFRSTHAGYSGSDSCAAIGGAAHGTGGIGVFAEAGSVMMPDQQAAFTATAGLTIRVPSTIGIFVGVPGCK